MRREKKEEDGEDHELDIYLKDVLLHVSHVTRIGEACLGLTHCLDTKAVTLLLRE